MSDKYRYLISRADLVGRIVIPAENITVDKYILRASKGDIVAVRKYNNNDVEKRDFTHPTEERFGAGWPCMAAILVEQASDKELKSIKEFVVASPEGDTTTDEFYSAWDKLA